MPTMCIYSPAQYHTPWLAIMGDGVLIAVSVSRDVVRAVRKHPWAASLPAFGHAEVARQLKSDATFPDASPLLVWVRTETGAIVASSTIPRSSAAGIGFADIIDAEYDPDTYLGPDGGQIHPLTAALVAFTFHPNANDGGDHSSETTASDAARWALWAAFVIIASVMVYYDFKEGGFAIQEGAAPGNEMRVNPVAGADQPLWQAPGAGPGNEIVAVRPPPRRRPAYRREEALRVLPAFFRMAPEDLEEIYRIKRELLYFNYGVGGHQFQDQDATDPISMVLTAWPGDLQSCVEYHQQLADSGAFPSASPDSPVGKAMRRAAPDSALAEWRASVDGVEMSAWVEETFFFDAVAIDIQKCAGQIWSMAMLKEFNKDRPGNKWVDGRNQEFDSSFIRDYFWGAIEPPQPPTAAAFVDLCML